MGVLHTFLRLQTLKITPPTIENGERGWLRLFTPSKQGTLYVTCLLEIYCIIHECTRRKLKAEVTEPEKSQNTEKFPVAECNHG